jgi:hypothetical protein
VSDTAYIFVVNKDVSPYLPVVPARNVTITLHPSVTAAEVITPGTQGRTGFDLGHGAQKKLGAVRDHFASIGRNNKGAVTVTVEVVGGGGAFIKLTGNAMSMQDAAYGKVDFFFDKARISLAPVRFNGPILAHVLVHAFGLTTSRSRLMQDRSGGSKLKAPSWAYGTFAFGGLGGTGKLTSYLPLRVISGLVLTDYF